MATIKKGKFRVWYNHAVNSYVVSLILPAEQRKQDPIISRHATQDAALQAARRYIKRPASTFDVNDPDAQLNPRG